MAKVTDIAEIRRKREAETKELWYCTSCGSHEFRLATDGFVVCHGCGDLIEDLLVVRLMGVDS